jgi:hypothetical protein
MTWNPINQQTQKENIMRTVTLSGQDFIVNPLKGKDIKALKAQGFDLMGGGYSISEGMDAVFATDSTRPPLTNCPSPTSSPCTRPL